MSKDFKKDISVVIPLNNEEKTINYLYLKLKEVLDNTKKAYEMIFVDDGSQDGTYTELCRIYSIDRNINILRLAKNYGQSAALAAGIDFARGEIILTMDGDLQHDPSEIPKFLEKAYSGYDLVIGWRKHRADNLFSKRIPSLVGNKLIKLIFKTGLHDISSNYRAYRSNVIKDIRLYDGSHRFLPLIINKDILICEIRIKCGRRKYGRSHYDFNRIANVIHDIYLIWRGKYKKKEELGNSLYSIKEIKDSS